MFYLALFVLTLLFSPFMYASSYDSDQMFPSLSDHSSTELSSSDSKDVSASSVDAAANAFSLFSDHKSQDVAELAKAGSFDFDPAKLTLSFSYDVKASFISETAGYQNTFGWYDARQPDAEHTVWANASGNGKGLAGGGSFARGDTTSLGGTLAAGSQLGLFVKANGFNDASAPTFYNDQARNVDQFPHMAAQLFADSGLLAISFEDLRGGGDRDFDDLVIVLDIGVANAQAMIGAPEPAEWALLFLGMVLMAVSLKRHLPDPDAVTVPARVALA